MSIMKLNVAGIWKDIVKTTTTTCNCSGQCSGRCLYSCYGSCSNSCWNEGCMNGCVGTCNDGCKTSAVDGCSNNLKQNGFYYIKGNTNGSADYRQGTKTTKVNTTRLKVGGTWKTPTAQMLKVDNTWKSIP